MYQHFDCNILYYPSKNFPKIYNNIHPSALYLLKRIEFSKTLCDIFSYLPVCCIIVSLKG